VIARIIAFSARNKFLVLLLVAAVTALGVVSAREMRLDALPDISDVQVIVVSEYPGQSPQVVEDQVTYPLTTALLSVPGARDVRGFSMFELSMVYVIFDDGTDLYWARSRVLEYLNVARGRLPNEVTPRLGPDATGLGWVYQYVLWPGWYCADYPNGLLHDAAQDRWYARQEDAPQERREALVRVRAFDGAGPCPLDGKPLVSSNQDLGQLRSLQDWYVRYELAAVPGVAEVASLGGFVKQYRVVLDPERLRAFSVPLSRIAEAIERSNRDVGGSVVEWSENEYMVRSRGYLRGVEDLKEVPLGVGTGGTPIRLADVATIEVGGESRRGIGDWNGEGEAVGGVVVARFGENAYKVIRDAKARLAELESGLPPGVFVKTSYDRSALIERSVDTLRRGLTEELIVVALIVLLFLLHVRSALVALLVLPLGLLASVVVMQVLGINANIMSIGGLALAIGVMVDSGVVMIENAHKHLEAERERVALGEAARGRARVVTEAAMEVGPSLFFSLLVITVAFLPIFALGGESGRLFRPLALTKTLAIAAGALLGITVVPVLMVLLVRGRIPREDRNPLNRLLQWIYEPFFHWVMHHPVLTLALVLVAGASALIPLSRLGTEFMPALDEGDLLYMPTTDPSISVTKAKELLQQTDRLIATFPEVQSVHGKIGRIESATDPAPLSMIESVARLHTDPDKWRRRPLARFHSGWPGWLRWPFEKTFWPSEKRISTQDLVHGWTDPDGKRHVGLNEAVSFPGVANAWPYPIENRINMLSTGIKTPVGLKFMGPDLEVLSDLAERAATVVRTLPGTLSAYPERAFGAYYLDVTVDRKAAARHGLTVGDVQDVVRTAIGGMEVTTTVEGLERYPVNVRYARELRDDLPALRRVLVDAPTGAKIPLGELAELKVNAGPPMIKSENARRTAWVFVDLAGRDLGGYVEEAKARVARDVALPAGYSLKWSGQFEYVEEANRRLAVVIPLTLAIIVLLLYAANRSWFRVSVILLAVPFSLIGAFWFLDLLDYHMSLAVWVGLIALAGVDAETGQVMLLYLDQSLEKARKEDRLRTRDDLYAAVHEGAVKRIRPKAMTVATDMIGLLPLLWATGTGAEVTRRLVAPLIGGIAVSFLMELLVYPVVFFLAKRWSLRRQLAA
jgi:Cu(I)/Ag(I) efflux system membrane protein CusA/SilA